MGFLAPALPWLVKGGAMLGGMLMGKKAQSSAQQRSPEEAQALQGGQAAGAGLQGLGSSLATSGQQATGQAQNYWSTLLGGNRAQMAQAVAGPRAALTDQYRGAERGLERSGIRGGVGDLARAELSRDRASKIAGLTTGVQPVPAMQLGEMGAQQTGQGASSMVGAGGVFQNLLSQGAHNREYARGEGEKAGSSLGSLIFDILSGTIGKKGPMTGGFGGGMPGIPGTGGTSPPWLSF